MNPGAMGGSQLYFGKCALLPEMLVILKFLKKWIADGLLRGVDCNILLYILPILGWMKYSYLIKP